MVKIEVNYTGIFQIFFFVIKSKMGRKRQKMMLFCSYIISNTNKEFKKKLKKRLRLFSQEYSLYLCHIKRSKYEYYLQTQIILFLKKLHKNSQPFYIPNNN